MGMFHFSGAIYLDLGPGFTSRWEVVPVLCGPSLALGWLVGGFHRRPGREEEQILYSADSYPSSSA